jgi:hypothetical protein
MGKSLEYLPPYIVLDQVKYLDRDVAIWKNHFGVFANTLHLNNTKKVMFMRAEKVGKINLYIQVDRLVINGLVSHTETLFYNKGFEKLKEAKKKTLKEDLKDNQGSINVLNKLFGNSVEYIKKAIDIYNSEL